MPLLPERRIIDALFADDYIDPFSVLGMHATARGLQLRVLLPNAKAVWVIDRRSGQRYQQLHCLDPRGFFVAQFAAQQSAFPYRLAVTWQQRSEVIDDAYQFDPAQSALNNWPRGEETFTHPYVQFGAHPITLEKVHGVRFSIWAPSARRVALVGDFNQWDSRRHPMRFRPEKGIWVLFIPHAALHQRYKFAIIDIDGKPQLKADPYAFAAELRPKTAAVICGLPDVVDMSVACRQRNALDAPIAIYEVHLGSWRRQPNGDWLTYSALAQHLIPYVKTMGFTHIELMPITEHPFDGSWGYQPIGLYAATCRYGTRDALRQFIATAHAAGLNVLLDWVPGHFPSDPHGLAKFDGTHLYEHGDPREGYHQDWHTLIYNMGRREVSDYLAGNALYWLERFGMDGLRIDAVTSMIYRDYSRQPGQWIANRYGGRENLEAIALLRRINQCLNELRPGCITIAEESTSFPQVTQSAQAGGLGFSFKWNMGWMHDTLHYLQLDPLWRKHHHQLMTFSMHYHYSENFVLPLSHDEVVHGKGSLLARMPGERWQQFATLRAYYAWMWAFPGKKMLFMGNEFAQVREWNCDGSLDWHLCAQNTPHRGVQRLVRDLNRVYRRAAPLYQRDFDPGGFEWLVVDDTENSVFAFVRRDWTGNEIIVVSNFTPIPRYHYRFGVNQPGHWRAIINTDLSRYHGTHCPRADSLTTQPVTCHQRPHALTLTLPPLTTLWLIKEESPCNR